MSRVEAAKQFDDWMKNYNHPDRHINKHLINFLNAGNGFQLIKTYEQFCQLSEAVQVLGYKTTNPPCELVDFAYAIQNANPRSFGDEKPVMPEGANIQLSAKQFDAWMKSWVESHKSDGDYDDNNKALVKFLNADNGFQLIKTYEQFCQLSEAVQVLGYKTTNPPCEPLDFDRALQEGGLAYRNEAGLFGRGERNMHQRKVAQSAETVAILDAIDGTPGRCSGPIYEDQLVRLEDIFKPF